MFGAGSLLTHLFFDNEFFWRGATHHAITVGRLPLASLENAALTIQPH